jgi:hypothetical protein
MTMNETRACACLSEAPHNPDARAERHVGRDETEGRFADVDLIRCGACGRLWLRYAVEYEIFTASGRWATVPISEETAATVTPKNAAGVIESAPWHIFGGSYFGHSGNRGRGRIHWTL